ncbi:MAG: UDP-N-acetylmuramoyl-L-alanyl-D-glutamate--2,6-diaminopimelate ligase [Planctomycetes bacterium]|nr:UDP-N-acetylmuramoyl-L-alanyl-D-glutamate--2,6-diaminopimelate ligase [Planctomycetota bacterium]
MLLAQLAQGLAAKIRPLPDRGGEVAVELRSACFDSRRVRPGDLYCALPGHQRHGADFLTDAIHAGAVAWLVDETYLNQAAAGGQNLAPLLPTLVVAVDQNVAAVAAEAAATIAGHPSRSMHLTAVTGTNGKSTIVHLMAQAWNLVGWPAGRIGTLGFEFDGKTSDSLNTTPSADLLQNWLREIQAAGARAVVLEASSHGIHQQRLAATEVQCIGWSNLSHDHLDYHHDMQSYAAAKAELIHRQSSAGLAFLPLSDSRIWEAVEGAACRLLSWSLDDVNADVHGQCLAVTNKEPDSTNGTQQSFSPLPIGIALQIDGAFGACEISSTLIGRHNAENLLLAFALLRASGLTLEQTVQGLQAATAAPGRLQQVAVQSPWRLFVDYAHTPEALQRVLKALRVAYPQQRIGIVCGAGGDRDPMKRGPMGQAAATGADWCMLTSDNPRSEDPDSILDALVAGAKLAIYGAQTGCNDLQSTIHRQVDRRLAIQKAVALLQPGDVLLVAGKGHEPYQEINGVRYPFDDCLVLEEAVQCCS